MKVDDATDAELAAMVRDIQCLMRSDRWPGRVHPPWIAAVTEDLGPVVGGVNRDECAQSRVLREAARRFADAHP